MNNRTIIFQIGSFIAYILIQVIFLRNVVLFDRAFCFIYIGFLLYLPVETNRPLLMGLGFLTGFIVDIFYDSLGIHAAACVLIMFVRNPWLNLLTPQGGFDPGVIPSMRLNGLRWFIMYSAPLIVLHHFALFFIEAAGFTMFGFTLTKVLLSSLFTLVAIIIAQVLFYTTRRGI